MRNYTLLIVITWITLGCQNQNRHDFLSEFTPKYNVQLPHEEYEDHILTHLSFENQVLTFHYNLTIQTIDRENVATAMEVEKQWHTNRLRDSEHQDAFAKHQIIVQCVFNHPSFEAPLSFKIYPKAYASQSTHQL